MRRREQLIEKLDGCIDDQRRSDDAEPLTPEDLKADWTSDLPS